MMLMAIDIDLQHGKRNDDTTIGILMCVQHSNLILKTRSIIIEKVAVGVREMADIIMANYEFYACDRVITWHRFNVFPLRQIMHDYNIPFQLVHVPPTERDNLLWYARGNGWHPMEVFIHKYVTPQKMAILPAKFH